MPNPSPPSYRKHTRNGRVDAFVEVDGRRWYLGAQRSEESRRAYRRILAEWEAGDGGIAPSKLARIVEGLRRVAVDGRTLIVQLCDAFNVYARGYYVDQSTGETNGEYANYRSAMRLLLGLYARTPADDFTPEDLERVRDRMIAEAWKRDSINRQVNRLRRIFQYGVKRGMVDTRTHAALFAVWGLRRGKTEAKETEPVRPVPEHQVAATLPHVAPVVADMVRVQLLTGARPGELVIMRAIDIDTEGETWLYTPARHKTEHHGRGRWIEIGPRAQEILARYMQARAVDAYLFSPAEADAQVRARRREARTTPETCGNRPGTNRQAKPRKQPAERYTTQSYGRAIRYGCEAAWPPPAVLDRERVQTGRKGGRLETLAEWRRRLGDEKWAQLQAWHKAHRWAPNRLRKTFGTKVRREAGLEAARAALGHTTISVTEQYYAEADREKVAAVVAKIG